MKGLRQNNGRERLIDAAGEVFGEKGLQGTTIRDITERARANIAAVNYHFRDKFELYLVVAQQIQDSLDAAVNKPLTAETAEGRLRELISAMLAAFHDPARPKWHRQLVGRELMEPTVLEMLKAWIQRHFSPLVQVVREIRPDLGDEQLRLATAGIVAQLVFHNHYHHLAQYIFPEAPAASLEALVNHVTEFSLTGLRGLGSKCTDAPRRAGQKQRQALRGGRASRS